MPLKLVGGMAIPDAELAFSAIRAQGAGGQNVNKVASAVHLRFDSQSSSALSEEIKARLLQLSDRRIGADGTILIKAQRFRTQQQNRRDALRRLAGLLAKAMQPEKTRKATRPSRQQREKRLADEARRAQLKSQRRPIRE